LALQARWGRLPLAAVFAPALELAEEGFVASIMLTLASHLVHDVAGAQELCPHGPLRLEEHVRLPSVARTLRAIVREGRQGFYQGEFGQALIEMGQGIFTAGISPKVWPSGTNRCGCGCGRTTCGPCLPRRRAT
jgi:gamma-glutamyltranspeptidase/glutathione hydrolase